MLRSEDNNADGDGSYTLTFMLLASEMTTFCVLVAPLPYAVRKRLFRFLSESPLVAKLAYGIKIAFMCVHLLLLSSCRVLVCLVCLTPEPSVLPHSLRWPAQSTCWPEAQHRTRKES